MRRRVIRSLFLATLALPLAREPATGSDSDEENPTSLPTVHAALAETRAKYGTEAAAFQGFLLNYAIRGGSVLDANVSIEGRQARHGREYLVYVLDTGIVYQRAAVSAPQQIAHIWADVVEPSVRRAVEAKVPAEGIGFRITYAHASYADRADLQRQLHEHGVTAVQARIYVSMNDAADRQGERITTQELADRSEVEVDGQPARIDLNLLREPADANHPAP